MSDIDIKVHGLEELTRKLDALPTKIHTKILRETMNEISDEMADVLARAAPVGEKQSNNSIKYGRLSDSIHEGKARKSKDTVKNKVFANFWWKFLEFGTKDRKTDQGWSRGRMTDTRRFVNPIIQSHAPRLLAKYTKLIAEKISKLK